MEPLVGVKKSLAVLKEALPRDFDNNGARGHLVEANGRVAATV